MQVTVQAEIGYGLAQTVTANATATTDDLSSMSRFIFKLFLPTDVDRSNDYVETRGVSDAGSAINIPVRVERRYELASGDPLRVEFTATSGFAGHPVQVTAAASGTTTATANGMSNEAIALTLTPTGA